jgi:hypothetical protein
VIRVTAPASGCVQHHTERSKRSAGGPMFASFGRTTCGIRVPRREGRGGSDRAAHPASQLDRRHNWDLRRCDRASATCRCVGHQRTVPEAGKSTAVGITGSRDDRIPRLLSSRTPERPLSGITERASELRAPEEIRTPNLLIRRQPRPVRRGPLPSVGCRRLDPEHAASLAVLGHRRSSGSIPVHRGLTSEFWMTCDIVVIPSGNRIALVVLLGHVVDG